jgi:hypothetical protein
MFAEGADDEPQDASHNDLQGYAPEEQFGKDNENGNAESDGHAFQPADLRLDLGGDIVPDEDAGTDEQTE